MNVQWFVGLQFYNKNTDSIKISVIKGFQVCLCVCIVHSRDNISNTSGAFQRMINFKATSSGTTDLLPSPKLLLHFIFSYKDGRTAKHQDSKLMTLFDENCWTNKKKHLFQVNTSVSPVKVIEKNFTIDNLSKPDTILVGTFMQHGLDPTIFDHPWFSS